MPSPSKNSANEGASVPVTRRTAFRTAGLAVVVAGLLGSAGSADAAQTVGSELPNLPADTPPPVDLSALTVEQRLAASQALLEARDRLMATLTSEQEALFDTYDTAAIAEANVTADYYAAEVARHAPSIAPVLSVLWPHVTEFDVNPADVGWCCRPASPRSVASRR